MIRRSQLKLSRFILGMVLLSAGAGTGFAKENSAPDGVRWRFHKSRRFFVIGDLHGDPDAYLAILTHLKLIDAYGDPTDEANNVYLATTGDQISKGSNSRFLLDYEPYLKAKMEERHGRLDILEGNQDFEAVIRPRGKVPPEDVENYGDFILPLKSEEVLRELTRQTQIFRRFGLSLDAQSEETIRNAQLTAQYYEAFRRAVTTDPVYYEAATGRNIFLQYPGTLILHAGFSDAMENITPEDAGRMNADFRKGLRDLFDHIATGSRFPAPELPAFMRGHSGPLHTRELSTGRFSAKSLKRICRAFGVDRVIIGHTRTKDGKIGTPYGIPEVDGVASLNDVLVFNVDTGIARLSDERKTGELSALEFDPDRGGIILHQNIARPTTIHPARRHLEPVFGQLRAGRAPVTNDSSEAESILNKNSQPISDLRQLEFDFEMSENSGPLAKLTDPGRFPKRLLEICQGLIEQRARKLRWPGRR